MMTLFSDLKNDNLSKNNIRYTEMYLNKSNLSYDDTMSTIIRFNL